MLSLLFFNRASLHDDLAHFSTDPHIAPYIEVRITGMIKTDLPNVFVLILYTLIYIYKKSFDYFLTRLIRMKSTKVQPRLQISKTSSSPFSSPSPKLIRIEHQPHKTTKQSSKWQKDFRATTTTIGCANSQPATAAYVHVPTSLFLYPRSHSSRTPLLRERSLIPTELARLSDVEV